MRFPSDIHTIGVFAPAGYPADPNAVARALAAFSTIPGIQIVLPEATSPHCRFFAAPDDARAAQLNDLLANPKIDFLLALKGGYGCARILDRIDWPLMQARNLPLCGYSDLTALHLAAFKHGCTRHIYGPMFASTFGQDANTTALRLSLQNSLASFEACLNGDSNLIAFGREKLSVLSPGVVHAPLVPVCLSILISLIGTPFMPDLSGCILAVEDINEPAHAIDRMMNQLLQTGILPSLSGLIYGTFHQAEDAEFLPEILREYAAYVKGPVIDGLQFGHIPAALSLPVGQKVTLAARTPGDIHLTR